MNAAAAPPRPRPPRQERSRRTARKILDALEAMLETQSFDAISVHELARRAGVSIGSLYARFPSKDTLVPGLYQRWDEQARSMGIDDAERKRAREMSLEEVAHEVTHRLVRRNRRRQQFMRAVSLHARQHPEMLDDELRARRRKLHAGWVSLVLEHRDRIRHPNPKRAVELAIFMTATTIREKVVFPDAPHAESFAISDRQLGDEMARAFLAYLGVTDGGSP